MMFPATARLASAIATSQQAGKQANRQTSNLNMDLFLYPQLSTWHLVALTLPLVILCCCFHLFLTRLLITFTHHEDDDEDEDED